jgi:hypothetical protein
MLCRLVGWPLPSNSAITEARDCLLLVDSKARSGSSQLIWIHCLTAKHVAVRKLTERLSDLLSRAEAGEAVVYFPPPRAEEHLGLWREGFSPCAQVTADLERIAAGHDLTGGAMINVIRRESPISHGDIEEAIRSEISKNC